MPAGGDDKVVVLHVTEIMPIHGGTSVELDLDREGLAAARRLGRELLYRDGAAYRPTQLE
jgi:hypothetical protein